MPLDAIQGIYAGAEVRNGMVNTSQWEDHLAMRVANLTRPEKWTHLHDYFALQKLHWARTWRHAGEKSEASKCYHLGLSFAADTGH